MPRTTPEGELRLLYQSERPSWADRSLLSLAVHPVRVRDNEEVRNILSDSWSPHGLADLCIRAQCDPTTEPYGWCVEYREVFSVDKPRAECMFKQLRAIERKLERLKEELGAPESFASYVARVGNAIGAKQYGRKADGNHWSYSGNRYQWGDPTSLAHWIDADVREFQKPKATA